MRGTLNSSSQTKKELSNKRDATTAVRCQSRPMPDTSKIKAHRYAKTSRAGTLLGSPVHVGVKSPWARPKIPRPTIVAAKNAWPQLATPSARVPVLTPSVMILLLPAQRFP